MKELVLKHLPPPTADAPAQVRLIYRSDERDRGQETPVEFAFALTPKQRNDLRWYLEEYLLSPYAVFAERAERIRQ